MGQRKFHNEELHNLYSLPNIIGVIKVTGDEMGGACSMHGRNSYRILVGNIEQKRALENSRVVW
jgi:2',3'-cyclic-nucleotide 2'-phosphodiesterase (5'-nucleotidase family)